jgi:hypothetical protein
MLGLPAIALELPAIDLGLDIGGLGSASILANASAELSAMLDLGLPAFPLSASLLMQLTATANATAHIKAALGIDLFSANASAQLGALGASINANLSAGLAAAFGLDFSMLLKIGAIASLVASIEASLGINLALPGAMAALEASLAVMAELSLSASAGLTNVASFAAAANLAASLGIDLSAGAGFGGAFGGAVELLASLELPSLDFDVALVASLVVALSAVANIKAVFGVDAFSAGAMLALEATIGGLPLDLLAKLSLSAKLKAVASAGAQLGPLVPMLGIDLSAMASLSASADLALPNLGPLSLVASLALNMGNLGISPIASVGCEGCPVAALL